MRFFFYQSAKKNKYFGRKPRKTENFFARKSFLRNFVSQKDTKR